MNVINTVWKMQIKGTSSNMYDVVHIGRRGVYAVKPEREGSLYRHRVILFDVLNGTSKSGNYDELLESGLFENEKKNKGHVSVLSKKYEDVKLLEAAARFLS